MAVPRTLCVHRLAERDARHRIGGWCLFSFYFCFGAGYSYHRWLHSKHGGKSGWRKDALLFSLLSCYAVKVGATAPLKPMRERISMMLAFNEEEKKNT